jgi:ABC-type glycerol-3-phosphate transport system substrate-binding protein
VDSPEDIKAWTWVHSFAAGYGLQQTQVFQNGVGSYCSSQNPFLIGKLVCQMDGPWFANFIRLYNPKLKWFVVPFPGPNGNDPKSAYTVLNLNTMMIPKGAKHPKEAFEFMAFVQKQKVMEQLCHDQFCNSPLSHVSSQFLAEHPNKSIDLFDKLAFSSNAVGRNHIGIYGQIMQELTAAGDAMDLGQATPAAALHAAQARLEGEWQHYQQQVLAP